MSGRFARLLAALVACVLLLGGGASSALAKPGGNAAAAAACEDGGYLQYTDAEGNAFENAGQCTRHAAQGNELRPVAFLAISYIYNAPDAYDAYLSGAGLQSGAPVTFTTFFWSGDPISFQPINVPDSGAFDNLYLFIVDCTIIRAIMVGTTDLNGNPIQTTEPLPC